VPYAARAEYLLREPLWVAATRNGVRTAVYHWPCATGPWEGVAPWRLEDFALGVPDSAALAFSEAALQEGAQLVMTYVSGTDAEGHRHGPGSAEVRRKLAALDAEIAPWVERMLTAHPGLRVLLLADHGMATMTRRVDLLSLLGQPGTVIGHGGSAYVYLKEPLAPGAIKVLEAQHLRAWLARDLPAAYHLASSPRIGTLVVEGPMGTWFTSATNPVSAATEQLGRHGAHGYDGAPSEMHTWLVALGTGKRTDLQTVPLWDIAPTVAVWLGLTWAQKPDGQAVAGLL